MRDFGHFFFFCSQFNSSGSLNAWKIRFSIRNTRNDSESGYWSVRFGHVSVKILKTGTLKHLVYAFLVDGNEMFSIRFLTMSGTSVDFQFIFVGTRSGTHTESGQILILNLQ
ncbi:unnamed protein product [Rhizophagus irregularis]|nr:unnamed protein product [Rhizophagus irregularis]